MDASNEWLYSELLELLKQEKAQEQDSYYQQIELELPVLEEPIQQEDENNKDERGVLIIES